MSPFVILAAEGTKPQAGGGMVGAGGGYKKKQNRTIASKIFKSYKSEHVAELELKSTAII